MAESRDSDSADLTPQFSRGAVDIIEREPVFEGFFKMLRLRLRHRLYRGGWSDAFERELFVRGAAVGVLLYDPERELVGLTEQFRVGALERPGGPWCLEVVAGMVEPDEPLEDVARREVFEESGLQVDELHFIHTYMPSPGGSAERLHLFCALADLRDAEGIFGLPEENEDIRLRVFPLRAILEAMAAGDPGGCPIDNAATIISLQWLQLNRAKIAEARLV
ncbi:NUDIX domain-containing protein [Microbulbifer halophilus]|uniref:ADP-ribose pyrophosphatase n=1 Tax=Microbulbifer halophilus TaxID=453963 RepID=A0ABW5EAY7_9GAMM|nr:NUDIX domain-containing protein [Microbulbifer halophilus]MCW8126814.1 NUDIX domain-containing protein [Microbulbifer halophilus]